MKKQAFGRKLGTICRVGRFGCFINKSEWFCIFVAVIKHPLRWQREIFPVLHFTNLCSILIRFESRSSSDWGSRFAQVSKTNLISMSYWTFRTWKYKTVHMFLQHSTKRQQNTAGIPKNHQKHTNPTTHSIQQEQSATHKSYNPLQEVVKWWRLLPLLCQYDIFFLPKLTSRGLKLLLSAWSVSP